MVLFKKWIFIVTKQKKRKIEKHRSTRKKKKKENGKINKVV